MQKKTRLKYLKSLPAQLFLVLITGIYYSDTYAYEQTITSPDNIVTLIELYTSQGCSSCPPAERWINKFDTYPNLWKTVIPINFHVDYWDYIGWKDPFADSRFTRRQRLYEYLDLSKNVATPGFIVDGKGWNGWFYGQEPNIENEPAPGRILAKIINNELSVEFSLLSGSQNSLSVHVAIMGFDLKTKVAAGENLGRELEHNFIVLGYDTKYLVKKDGKFQSKLTLPNVSKYDSARKGIVIWVSPRNSPKPIQAAGDWFIH